jgi:HSP20 family protein
MKEVNLMNAITLWRPRNDLLSLSDAVDRFFGEGFLSPRSLWLASPPEGLAIDMYKDDGNLVVKAEVPGVKPEELEITIKDNVLNIAGETKTEEEVKRENYIRRERRYGSFLRSVVLPAEAESDQAEATFEEGLLTVTIPVAEEAKSDSVKVEIKES